MTIEAARQILGEEIQNLTDKEVLILIADVGSVCDTILDVIVNRDLKHIGKGVYDG